MKKVSGIFTGVGTLPLYIGLGFIPDEVRIRNIGEAEAEDLKWNVHMSREADGAEGILRVNVGDSPSFTLLTLGEGVEPYEGEGLLGAADANKLVLADTQPLYQGDMKQKGAADVNKWTLQTAATYKGKFNAAINATYVGVGSEVVVRQSRQLKQKAFITAIIDTGESDNEVTLSRALPTGEITFIGYKSDFVTAPAGSSIPAGIKINDVTYVNVSGQPCIIEASQFDQNL